MATETELFEYTDIKALRMEKKKEKLLSVYFLI